jgi:hypothetical protein
VDKVETAQPIVEALLDRDAKRWELQHVATDGSPQLTYRVRAKRSIGLDGLREHLLREGAPHVVAADEPPHES